MILGLIQVGGLGHMTLGSFIIIAGTHAILYTRKGVIRTEFALPEKFNTK